MTTCAACSEPTSYPVIVRGLEDAPGVVVPATVSRPHWSKASISHRTPPEAASDLGLGGIRAGFVHESASPRFGVPPLHTPERAA